MKRLALLLAILAVPTIMLISCSKNSPTAPSLAPDQGKMMFALDDERQLKIPVPLPQIKMLPYLS